MSDQFDDTFALDQSECRFTCLSMYSNKSLDSKLNYRSIAFKIA